MLFSRYSTNFLAIWWRSLDKLIVISLLVLIVISIFFSYVSTYSIASTKLYNDSSILFKKHLIFMTLGILGLIIFSIFNDQFLKTYSNIFFLITSIFLISVFFFGIEVKGAKRWIEIKNFRIQPVEFIKPFYILYISKFICDENVKKIKYFFSGLITFFLVFFLISQPDYSQSLILLIIWFILMFISGINFILIFLISIFSVSIMISALFIFKDKFLYIFSRLDVWINSSTTSFQSQKALNAIKNGGFFGQGIGEGNLKSNVPEAHTDYVLAVIAEEFGIAAIILIILVFLILALRVFSISQNNNDKFRKIALIGLISAILLQTLINLGVTINILPTTGITFPLFSYGGSSLISSLIIFGLILNLTRKRI